MRHARNTPTIPYAADIVAGYDLCESTSLDMANFDETRVEEQHVGRVPSNVLCRAFPFDGANGPARIAMPIDVQAELCWTSL